MVREGAGHPMTEALFALLAGELVPWVLSAAILAGALALWITFRLRLEPVVAAVRRARREVEACEGPAAFRARFAQISRELGADPILGEAWKAWVPTVQPFPGEGEVLAYARRPRDQFDQGLLVRALNLRFYEAVPNLLVGLGLLFTFIGLVAALHFASRGVAAADITTAQASLRDLLGAATFKFATSIAGLASSILFTWRERAQLHRAQHELARLCDALEARMVPLTAEGLAAAQLEVLRQQRQDLARLARSDFAELPEAVERAFAAEIARAFAPLHEAIARLARSLEGEGAELLREAVAGRPRRVRVGVAAVEPGAGASDDTGELLRELRRIRAALEAGAGNNRGDAPLAASADEDPLLAAVGEGVRRLARLADWLARVRERLAGGRVRATRRELLALVDSLHGRVRELRRQLRHVRERLAQGEASPAEAAEVVRAAEGELVRAREALRALGSRLGEG